MVTLRRFTVRGIKGACYLVFRNGDGEPIGMLEKWHNTRSATHPWKAYVGQGMALRFLEAFYGPTGQQEAINAVLAESPVSA